MTYPPSDPGSDDAAYRPSLDKQPDAGRDEQPTEQPGYGYPPPADTGYGYPQNPGAGQPNPAYGQSPYGQQPYAGAPYPQAGGGAPAYLNPYGTPMGSTTNGKAIAALVCGIASFLTCLLFVGIPAVILGNMAIAEIDAAHGSQDGRGMAVAGRVLGWIAIALTIIVLVIVLIALIAASSSA
ncbi:hypothetical protein ASG12_14320 [Williamsia sp. Leaf354]|jgi:hypothetical protein|uniref:DUF4190 domain-containing protein n=1 Tax=Williamsia sp. Leaf354 TaxID=1736349 RepID=UPI0006F3AAA8|nr:DUF4190 domain-containing protein [Williamsia sp. Leaf354]KQR98125.1 hypothetical protein ASG12_14320 [Williamsia sp. Leaf354]